ncbi:10751_t:CDS:2, partial [Entrophospora sp. SA101]
YNLDDPTTPTTTATLQKTKADDVEVEMDNKGKLVAILILLLMLVIEWSLRKQQRSIPEQKIILFMSSFPSSSDWLLVIDINHYH